MAASSSRKVSLRLTRLSSNGSARPERQRTAAIHLAMPKARFHRVALLPIHGVAAFNLPNMSGTTLPRGFVDIYQGCCILEKASVTTCPDYATKSGGHMNLRTSYPQNNGAQATGIRHQKTENREVSW
jgi:hypothetical protein